MRVLADDVNGGHADEKLAPFREIYVFGSHGIRVLTANYTAKLVDATLLLNSISGGFTVQLPPAINMPNQKLTVQKISTDGNVITLLPAPGEEINDQTIWLIFAQWDGIVIQSDPAGLLWQ